MKIQNIFDHLKEISKRPQMYIGELSLEKLEVYLFGYISALQIHNIQEESVPDYDHFYQWVTYSKKLNCLVGGCRQFREFCKNEEEAFELFFLYAEEYSKITLELGEEFSLHLVNKRSDDFYIMNPGLKQEPVPNILQITYLRPGNLCFIKYVYDDKTTNGRSLYIDLDSALYTINWEFGTNFKK